MKRKKKSIPLSLEVANFSVFKLIQLIMGFVFGFVVAYLCGVAKENKKQPHACSDLLRKIHEERGERIYARERERERERERA